MTYRELMDRLQGARRADLTGKLESFDEYSYDGEDEYWSGTSWSLKLDPPLGEVVVLELEEVFRAFEDKQVRVTVEVLDALVEAK